MNQSPNVVQPRAYWYFVSLVVLIAGIGLASWQLKRTAGGIQGDVKPVRDQGLVEFDHAGSYSLYVVRYASQRMDAAAEQAWARAETAVVRVRDERTSASLAVRNVYETVELANTLMARVVEFEIPAPGTYRIQTTPPLDVLKPAIRPSAPIEQVSDDLMGGVVGFLIGIAIGAAAFILAAAIFFTVLVKRKNFKKRVGMSYVARGVR